MSVLFCCCLELLRVCTEGPGRPRGGGGAWDPGGGARVMVEGPGGGPEGADTTGNEDLFTGASLGSDGRLMLLFLSIP